MVHCARKFGKSKFGTSRYFYGFFDLLTVMFVSKYTHKPLHLFGIIGLLFFGSGFGINLYLTYGWFHGLGIGYRPLLFLGVLLIILGIQFFSIGLLGEMIVNFNKGEKRSYKIMDQA